MTTAVTTPLTWKDYRAEVEPDWCPGCGDYGVLNALFQTFAELGLAPHRTLVVSGIGCSSNLPGFVKTYGVHSLHGRSLPVATGAKLANHAMTVVATGGDGDGYGIGAGHFVHAMRRNIDITYIVMNNEVYGLTTGQTSPTSETGMVTKTAPHGNLEGMLNPMALALAMGCGYIARGFSGQPKHLMKLYREAIQYPGFALIDVFSPCVTFNKVNTFDFFKKRVYNVDETDHDPSDRHRAMDVAMTWGEKVPIGLIYRNPNPRPSLDMADPGLGSVPLVNHPAEVSAAQRKKLIEEFM